MRTLVLLLALFPLATGCPDAPPVPGPQNDPEPGRALVSGYVRDCVALLAPVGADCDVLSGALVCRCRDGALSTVDIDGCVDQLLRGHVPRIVPASCEVDPVD